MTMKMKIMQRCTIVISAFIIFWATATGCAATNSSGLKQQDKTDVQVAEPSPTGDVNAVLTKLNQKTSELVSYEGQIEYKFTQPALFNSQMLRKGQFYYQKKDNKTNLRINFQTLSQDQEKEKKYIEQYVVLDGTAISGKTKEYKGTWLVFIDEQTKELKYFQLAEPNDSNKPVDIFDLISRHMPIVGFTHPQELKKQFDISLVAQKASESVDTIELHLVVKPTSDYKDDYRYIDIWLDKTLFLPVKIVTVTTEEDIYEIKLLKPKINASIAANIFDFTAPKGFNEPQVILLKEKTNKK
jgi:hypothetical protein